MTKRTSRARAEFRPILGVLEERALMSGGGAAAAEVRVLARPAAKPSLPSGYSLTAFTPKGTPPPGGWPVVVAFEGAALKRTDSRAYAAKVAAVLVPAGIAVVGVGYPDQHFPATLDRGLLRAVAVVASNPKFNRDAMGAIGESAGATLALQVAMRSPKGIPGVPWTMRAVGDFYGATDFNRMHADVVAAGPRSGRVDTFAKYLTPYLGRYNATRYAAASPLTYARPDGPAVFLADGTDERTGTAQSDTFADRLAEVGQTHEYLKLEGYTHGFGPSGQPGTYPGQHGPASGTSREVGPRLRAFFVRYLVG